MIRHKAWALFKFGHLLIKKLIENLINIYPTFIFNQKLKNSPIKFSKEMNIDTFSSQRFKTNKTTALWGSSLWGGMLQRNYEYSIDLKNKEINFKGMESIRRWLSISSLLKELKILTKEDVVIDVGCSSGGLINAIVVTFGCKGIGVDINVDGCLDYAASFGIRNSEFIQLAAQDLFTMQFDRRFKLLIFTYQSMGGPNWLSNKVVNLNFFLWVKHTTQYLLMNDPRNKMPLPKTDWFQPIATLREGAFFEEYPLTLYKIYERKE